MTDFEYEKNVDAIICMLLKNARNAFELDFGIINDTAIENSIRLRIARDALGPEEIL